MYKSNGDMAYNWFAYLGGDVWQPGSYYKLSNADPDVDCLQGCVVCAIRIDDNNDYPSSLPASVRTALVTALATRQNQNVTADIRIRMKPC